MPVFTSVGYKDHVVSTYETMLKKKLENMALEIKNLLESIIDSKVDCGRYSLTHHNSGYLGKYYKITTRVKNGDSLGEKLVNKDVLLEIKDMVNDGDTDKIIEELENRYADLIGVKILGDLNLDVKNILQLLKENKNRFRDSHSGNYITFNNIDDQPDTMANGKEIIKIDCVYHRGSERYKFELQIKSQLVSAWGDMEHQHFYKNNRFSTLRKSQEPIMRDVGELLEQVDKLLLSIRSTEQIYKENEPYWEFRNMLQEQFSDKLLELFGLSVDATLSKITKFLFLMDKIVQPNAQNYNYNIKLLSDIEGGEYIFNDDINPFVNSFIKYRNIKLRIRVIEAIFLIWFTSKTNPNLDSSKQIYVGFIKWYCTSLLEAIQKFYKTKDSEVPFNPIFYYIINNIESEECFINLELYKETAAYYKFTKDAYMEWKEEITSQDDIFSLEVFYTINYLFAESHIAKMEIEDVPISLKRKISQVVLDEYFTYLIKDESKTVNTKFIDISQRIQQHLRKGLI